MMVEIDSSDSDRRLQLSPFRLQRIRCHVRIERPNSDSIDDWHAFWWIILLYLDSFGIQAVEQTIQIRHRGMGLVVEDDKTPGVRPAVRHGSLYPAVRIAPIAGHAVPQDARVPSRLEPVDNCRVQ